MRGLVAPRTGWGSGKTIEVREEVKTVNYVNYEVGE